MKKIIAVLLFALLVVSPISSASANNDQALTRGQFFKLVADHLGYDAANVKAELPKDIPATSPYADAAKILKDKKIVVGFGDGTFKPDQKITAGEVSSIIARFLGLKGDAKSALASNYGVSFDNAGIITLEKAQEIIAKTLSSDKSALEVVDKMTVAQNNVNSYQANAKMTMEFKMKAGTAEIPGMTDGMKMDSDIVMNFNKEKGLHQQLTTTIPNPTTNEQEKMVIDQYFVPEGIFMRMTDPVSGEDQWLDMSASMPFSFTDLMNMNEDNMNVMNDLNRKYFFYRDLGMEELNGSNYYKIAFSGKINSLEEIMGVLSSVFKDQSEAVLSSLENLPDIEMTMTGYMWIDEKTMLPSKQTIQYEIKYGATKDPAMVIPIESINYDMDFTFLNFNNVNDVVLPEEAKNAEKMPSLYELTNQPAPNEQQQVNK